MVKLIFVFLTQLNLKIYEIKYKKVEGRIRDTYVTDESNDLKWVTVEEAKNYLESPHIDFLIDLDKKIKSRLIQINFSYFLIIFLLENEMGIPCNIFNNNNQYYSYDNTTQKSF